MKLILILWVLVAGFLLVLTDDGVGHDTGNHRTALLRLASAPNEVRSDANLPVLRWERDMNIEAQHAARVLCDINILRHSVDISTGVPDNWEKAGENVGYTNQGVSVLNNAFINSPSHYNNIVDPVFKWIGFGTCWNGNTRYVVYRFAG